MVVGAFDDSGGCAVLWFDDSGGCAVGQKTLLQLAPGGELGHWHTF